MIRQRQYHHRHGHRRTLAQAVIEMAMVFPIAFTITLGFIGMMILVETQQELQTALQLAAQSSFQADTKATTGGVLNNCLDAETTFTGTMAYYEGQGFLILGSGPLCSVAHISGFNPSGLPASQGISTNPGSSAPLTCYLYGNLNANGNPINICTASLTIEFSKSPVGVVFFFNPTIHAQSEAVPPPFRQFT